MGVLKLKKGTYYDRWGCEILEQDTLLGDHGGYEIAIVIEPKVWWRRALLKFGFNFFPLIAVDLCEDSVETTVIHLRRRNRFSNCYKGVFLATRGVKTVKVSIEPNTLDHWDINVNIERLYS
jgi:hypothetical protein